MKKNSLMFIIGKRLPSKSPIIRCQNTDYALQTRAGYHGQAGPAHAGPVGLLFNPRLGGRCKQVSDSRYVERAIANYNVPSPHYRTVFLQFY